MCACVELYSEYISVYNVKISQLLSGKNVPQHKKRSNAQ